MIGTIGAALVTAVTTIVVAVSHDNGTAVGLPIGSVTNRVNWRADQQLGWVMAGDPRGLYGEYAPARVSAAAAAG